MKKGIDSETLRWNIRKPAFLQNKDVFLWCRRKLLVRCSSNVYGHWKQRIDFVSIITIQTDWTVRLWYGYIGMASWRLEDMESFQVERKVGYDRAPKCTGLAYNFSVYPITTSIWPFNDFRAHPIFTWGNCQDIAIIEIRRFSRSSKERHIEMFKWIEQRPSSQYM